MATAATTPSREPGFDLPRPQPVRYVNGQPISVDGPSSPTDRSRIASSGPSLALDATHATSHLRFGPFGSALISAEREFGEGGRGVARAIRATSPRSDTHHFEGKLDTKKLGGAGKERSRTISALAAVWLVTRLYLDFISSPCWKHLINSVTMKRCPIK